MSEEFKAGDKVYCPVLGTCIFEVKEVDDFEYHLKFTHPFAEKLSGNFEKGVYLPFAFHATNVTKSLLEQLYGVEFEAPALTFADMLKAHFCAEGKPVLCSVSSGTSITLIEDFDYDANMFYSTDGTYHGDPYPVGLDAVTKYLWATYQTKT